MAEVTRAFYRAYTASAMPTEAGLPNFWAAYAQLLDLRTNPFAGLSPSAGDELVLWNSPTAGAADAIRALRASGARVAIVSNAAGDVDWLLASAGVCQVGNGPAAAVDAIYDSGTYADERQARKPNATMLTEALRDFSVAANEAMFVGDALWADGQAAARAAVPFLHMDPYSACRDTELPDTSGQMTLHQTDHDHVGSMREVVPFGIGIKPRLLAPGPAGRSLI